MRGRVFICHLLFLSLFLSWELAGQELKITSLPTNHNGYSITTNKTLYLSKKGVLWYSTYGGIIKDQGGTGALIPFNHPLKSRENSIIVYCFSEREGTIYAGTNSGIFFVNTLTGESGWIAYINERTGGLNDFSSIKNDHDGNLWFININSDMYRLSADKKISVYSLNEEGLMFYVSDVLEDNALILRGISSDEVVRGIYKVSIDDERPHLETILESDQYYYYLTDNGALFPEGTSGHFFHEGEKIPYGYIPSIDRQVIYFNKPSLNIIPRDLAPSFSQGIDFFLISERSLLFYKIEKTGQEYHTSLSKKVELNSTISFTYYSKYQDFSLLNNGTLIVDTDEGIKSIKFIEEKFEKHLPGFSTRSFQEDSKGNIYVYAYSSFFVKKKGSNGFEKLRIKAPIDLYDFILQDDSTLWALSEKGAVYRYDLNTRKRFSFDSLDRLNTTYQLMELAPGELLIASDDGLLKFNTETHSYAPFNQLSDSVNLSNKRVYSLLLDSSKRFLWMGMGENGGVYKKDLVTNEVSHYSFSGNGTNNVRVIHEDEMGGIWLGTEGGIQKIGTDPEESVSITKKDGLKNERVTGIADSGDALWFATFNGLVRFDSKTRAIENFTVKDGLPDNEFNYRSFFTNSGGEVFAGGINGVVRFHPDSIDTYKEEKKLWLVGIKKHEQGKDSLGYSYFGNKQHISLPYNHNYISFLFSINDIVSHQESTYQYRIREIDEAWVDLGKANELNLFGLKPDRYTIEIRGITSRGDLTNQLRYDVVVEQIFYKRLWFIILSGAVFIFVVAYFFYRKYLNLKKEIFYRKRLLDLESKATQAQMNPHFISNALGAIQGLIIKGDELKANKYLVLFSKLLRLTLEINSSDRISLENEVQYLESYIELEKLRLGNNLSYNFDIEPGMDLDMMKIPCMLLQPIVENSIHHGLKHKEEDRVLSIAFKEEQDFLVSEIVDNGIGRAASREKNQNRLNHKSFAMNILGERIHLYNSVNKDKITFKIENLMKAEKPLGTRVVFHLPKMY
ncbi:histidine kinase [Winogradskyella sp. 3972H.M.0a.05]|uniref:sensor histidine kinase n=1 Tax=Winogradskyella sp. 3972H.M.0a.05 TaxID=2950277 RepID=UPI0033983B12